LSFDRDTVTLENNLKIPFGDAHRGRLESKVNIVLSDVRGGKTTNYTGVKAMLPLEAGQANGKKVIFLTEDDFKRAVE
jgi:hypothetical protein